jgi:lipopolysaccharide export system protein LptA
MRVAVKVICFALIVAYTAAIAVAAGAEPKTVVTGEQMEMSGGGKVVVFTGGAKVAKGVNELTADKIVQDKQRNRVEAYGRVVFKTINQAKEPMRGTSEKAVYDIQNDSGELSGSRPEIVYYANTSTGPVTMRAEDISFNQEKEELYARDNVEIISSSATAYAPSAVFYQKIKTMVLTGPMPQPLVVYYDEAGKSNKYKADKITFLDGGNRIKLEGNVKAVVMVENRKDKTAKKQVQK